MKLKIFAATFFVIILFQSINAQIPKALSFQGILTDTTGTAKPDGVYLLTFRLYATAEGGAPLWSEQNSIEVNKGLFSHNLGSINNFSPDVDFSQSYWLTMEVSGESELMPRIPLTSSAYSFSSIKSQFSDTALVAMRSDTATIALVTLSDTLWKSSGTNIYRLNGNVGIGRIPSFKLDVEGTIRSSEIVITENAGTGKFFISENNSGLGTWSNDINSINGNIGIGTASPVQKLDVNGIVRSARLQMTTGSSNGRFLSSNSDGLASWNTRLFTSGNDLIYIGDLGINDSTPNAPLHVVSNPSGFEPIANRSAIIENSGLVSLALRSSSTSTTGTHAIYFERPIGVAGALILLDEGLFRIGRYTFTSINTTASSYRFNFDLASGNFGIGRDAVTNKLEVSGNASKSTAGDWLANSDSRIKTDIKDIDNAKELLKKLRPVKFHYSEEWKKRNPDIKDHYYYNFVAQEFKEVFPNSVKGSGEYLNGDPEEILQIDTYNAQIITIKVAQELVKENENLRAEINELRSKLNQLISNLKNSGESLVQEATYEN